MPWSKNLLRPTVTSLYQTPLCSLCPPPPLRSEHGGFGTLLSHIARMPGSWIVPFLKTFPILSVLNSSPGFSAVVSL